MLFSLQVRDQHSLSRHTRFFIRIHHLDVVSPIVWIGYLFTIRELL